MAAELGEEVAGIRHRQCWHELNYSLTEAQKNAVDRAFIELLEKGKNLSETDYRAFWTKVNEIVPKQEIGGVLHIAEEVWQLSSSKQALLAIEKFLDDLATDIAVIFAGFGIFTAHPR